MSREEKPHGQHGREDPLGELLRSAQWPAPQPERLARLQRVWQTLVAASIRRRRRRNLLVLAAVAAALLAAVLVWRSLPPEQGPAPATPTATVEHQHVAPPPEAPQNSREPKPAPSHRPPAPDPVLARPSVASSRPPSRYEAVAFRVLTRRRPARPDAPPDDPLEAALQRIVRNPDADLDQLASPLISRRQLYEARLAYEIRQCKGPRRLAAIGLLGRMGTARSVPLLHQLSRVPDLREASFPAMARLADSETLARLAATETDASLKRSLISALVARNESTALAAYLRLVAAPATRQIALELLDQRPDLSRDALFEFLHSSYPCQRQGAALVLGRLDGPETHRRLLQMVAGGVHRQEALMALLASPSPEAAQFVALARRDPSLAGALISAQYQLGMSCL